MPERQPLTVSVRPDQLKPALAAMGPMQVAVFMQLVLWMSVNAAPLPEDFNEVCVIANARSMEARRAVTELTGLGPSSSLVTVTVTRDGIGVGHSDGHSDGMAFIRAAPRGGLTLREGTAWGISPLTASASVELQRERARDRQRKHRALNSGHSDKPDSGHRDSCARNSEDKIPNTEIQRALLLPSVVVAHAARAHEARTHEAGGEEQGTAEGRRRGAALAVMRSCGLTGINGLHPDFLALLATGITDDELRWGAEDAFARGKGFPYAVRALLGARQDAVGGTVASTVPGPSRLSQAEARASAWAGPLGVAWKPPE